MFWLTNKQAYVRKPVQEVTNKQAYVRKPVQEASSVNLQLRDGRQLRLQAKPKAILAMERFLARGSGFLAKEPDACLKSLGLESICPTHHFRHDFLLYVLCWQERINPQNRLPEMCGPELKL